MSGHFLGGELGPDERERMARDVQLLSVQAAALLGLLRRLDASGEPTAPVEIGACLAGVAATLEGAAPPGRLRLAKGRGLPAVRARGEALHQVLVALLSGGLASDDGPVRLRARVEGRRLLLEVTDAGPTVVKARAPNAATGRALTAALADAVLRGMGGRLRPLARRRGNAFVVSLPAVAR